MASLLFLPLVLLTLNLPPTLSFNAHDTIHVSHESTHTKFLAGSGYGFSPGATADLTLTSMYIQPSGSKDKPMELSEVTGKPWEVYFMLRQYPSANAFASEYEAAVSANVCMATSAFASSTDIILDASDPAAWDTVKRVGHNFTKADEGLYFLTWQRCYPVAPDADHRATFTFTHHLRNSNEGRVDYLSAGEAPLPTMYLVFGLVYAVVASAWFVVLKRAKESEFGPERGIDLGVPRVRTDVKVHHIHYLMAMLLVVKTLTVLADSAKYHYIRWTGSGEAWSVIYYMFEFLKGVMLFVVILLIGSGWSFVKPFLNGREKKTVLVVLVLQVFDNIAIAVVSSDTPGSTAYVTWESMLHLVDIICCGLILFPIVWQIRALELAVAADDKAERTIKKLTLFRQFYILVVGYVYFTRIIVYLIATMLTFKDTWMQGFINELATVAFYVTVGYKFRPQTRNPYIVVRGSESDEDSDDDEEEVSMRRLNEEEFGLPDDDELEGNGAL